MISVTSEQCEDIKTRLGWHWLVYITDMFFESRVLEPGMCLTVRPGSQVAKSVNFVLWGRAGQGWSSSGFTEARAIWSCARKSG